MPEPSDTTDASHPGEPTGRVTAAADDDVAPAATGHRPVRGTDAAVVVTEAAVVLGVVMGVNQLATQSPVDAILPVALVSVGVAGLSALVAGLLGLRRAADRTPDADHTPAVGGPPSPDGPADALDPPGLDDAVASFALGIAALAAVGWRWGVAAQAALVGVQGLRLLLATEAGVVATLRRAPGRPDPYRLALTAGEAVALLVFAIAALADGSIRPFT